MALDLVSPSVSIQPNDNVLIQIAAAHPQIGGVCRDIERATLETLTGSASRAAGRPRWRCLTMA